MKDRKQTLIDLKEYAQHMIGHPIEGPDDEKEFQIYADGHDAAMFHIMTLCHQWLLNDFAERNPNPENPA